MNNMTSFLELKRQAERLITQSNTLAKKLGFDSVAEGIQQSLEQFRQKEMMVVVAGEARRGKSSLLNALLNTKEGIFPVDVNVCTNVVTVLRYGKQAKLEVVLDDSRTETLPMDQNHIADYVSEQGNPNNYKNVRLLNICLPMDALKDGIVFVDTPGVGSLNIEHAETTYAFLPNADLLIFVSDTNAGFTETELNFLKRSYQYCKNVVFPLTKKDLNANYGVIAEDNREKIHRTLNIPMDEIQIIPVSSSAKLRYLERGIKSLYVNSNYAQLETAIWDTIAVTRASAVILPYLIQVHQHLLQIQDSVAAQYQMLHAGQEKTQELIQQLEQESQHQKSLQEKGAEWRADLSLFSSTLGYELNPMVQATNDAAIDCLEAALQEFNNEICQEKNYMQVLGEINHIISCDMIQIRTYLEEELSNKCDEIQAELGLDMAVNEMALQKIVFQPDQTLSVVFPQRKTSEKIMASGRKIGSSSYSFAAVGSVAGALVGFVLGGPIGAVAGAQVGGILGGATGSAKGCIDALKKFDELDKDRVSKAIRKHIATSISGMKNSINTATTELRVTLSAAFEQQLKQQVMTIQESINQLQKNVKLSRAEIPGKLAGLKQQDELLKGNLSQLQAMEEQIQTIHTPCISVSDTEPPRIQTQKEALASYGFL